MKMIAKAVEGKEFFYDRNSAHKVSARSAEEICAALNEKRYKLADGQIWNIYEAGWYEAEYTAMAYQTFYKRNGNIYRKCS